MDAKIGDQVDLVAPSGNSTTVTVTDVIRDPFTLAPLALEFRSSTTGELVTLPIRFFPRV